MKNVKEALVWTNPLTYIFGVPILCGIVIAAITCGTFKRTKYVIKKLKEE